MRHTKSLFRIRTLVDFEIVALSTLLQEILLQLVKNEFS